MAVTLVLGGARSGKSSYAEALAAAGGADVAYIATARRGAGDAEMAARIAHHRTSRPPHWRTVEEALLLGDAIERESAPGRVVLVDCLTVWLSNLMFSDGRAYPEIGVPELPPLFTRQRANLLDVLARVPGEVVLVSNEVGMGIVPMGAISRAFVDQAGWLNQAVAARAGRVVFVAAGLPLVLKAPPC